MKALDIFRKLFQSRQPLTIEERITQGMITPEQAALLKPHHKRLYDKWAAKRAKT